MNLAGEFPKVVVSLGTDHHEFNRLVDWIDRWLEYREAPVECLVQHGFSSVPQRAKAVERMPRPELLELYKQSDVVVVQGGPGSILDARGVGRIPIAVPRRADLNEVVDGHQRIFTEFMVQQGDAIMVESYAELVSQLERAIAAPGSVVTSPRVARPSLAAGKLEAAISAQNARPDKGRTRRRLKQLLLAKKTKTEVGRKLTDVQETSEI